MQTKYMAAAPPPEEPPSCMHSSSVDSHELSVSFRYLLLPDGDGEAHHQCPPPLPPPPPQNPPPSFRAIWAAGLNANPTLQNTDLGLGRFKDQLFDSPTSMIRRPSTSSSDLSSTSFFPDSPPAFRRLHSDGNLLLLRRRRDELLGGGAVGEDRVQVVCAHESSLLFCAIYDGFNGRDVADFLSATLFRRFSERLELLEEGGGSPPDGGEEEARRVTAALAAALREAEAELMEMVAAEASAAERQTLAMVGACVAVVVVRGRRMYYMNLGDSKVVLASRRAAAGGGGGAALLEWVQLTEEHAAATNAEERRRILAEHSCEDSASLLYGDRVKGKVGVTRAIGAAFLKQKELNEILLPCFKVDEMLSPPYISTEPHIGDRWIRDEDCFVVMASDGLFDVLSNHEVVSYVDACLRDNLQIGPAHYLLSQFRLKVARQADMSVDTLRNLRYGTRRDYHDDVSIIVIRLM